MTLAAVEDVPATEDSPAIDNQYKRDMAPENKEIFDSRVKNLIKHIEAAALARKKLDNERAAAPQ